ALVHRLRAGRGLPGLRVQVRVADDPIRRVIGQVADLAAQRVALISFHQSESALENELFRLDYSLPSWQLFSFRRNDSHSPPA
ncbi:hypothetical protein CDN99_27880, partial [Roseateles aquatilis]